MAVVFYSIGNQHCCQYQSNNPNYKRQYLKISHFGTSLSIDLEANLHVEAT